MSNQSKKTAVTSVPSAIDRTAAYLRDCLRKGLWVPGDRLPSLDDLAQKADVSRTTMWKAIGILKDEKQITVKRGGRIIAGSPEETAAIQSRPPASKLWQKKRIIIEQDILNGVYSHGELLPSSSELQARYGVCFATLKKILNTLVTDKVLVPFKKSYMLPRLAGKRFQSTIVLLLEGRTANEFILESERVRTIIAILESECLRANLRLLPVGYDPTNKDMAANLRPMLQDDDLVVGYILDLWWVSIHEIEQRFLDLIHELAIRKKPVAILDEATSFVLPLPFSTDRNLCVFRMAGRSAGADAARFMLNQGHRYAAYISFQYRQLWAKNRFQGATEQFEKAGLAGNLVPFVLDEIEGGWQLVLALFDMTPEVFGSLFTRTLSREETADLVSQFRSLKARGVLKDRSSPDIRRLRDALGLLPELKNRIADTASWSAVLDGLWDRALKQLHEPYLEPVFEQVLADKRITAWICSEDATATAALKFLRRKNVAVPQEISVFGFDNVITAFEYRLTSYDFNLRGIVQRMLQFVFSPLKIMEQSRSQSLEVDGIIMVRDSTGRPSRIR